MSRLTVLAALFAAIAAAGCASTNPQATFDSVSTSFKDRSGMDLRWSRSSAQAAETEQLVRQLLAEPIDAERAERIALLNNPELQAELEELGIAQADLARATRIANPSLDAFVRAPRGGGAANVEVSIAEDILDVLMQPLRRRLGMAALEETKLRVGDKLLRAGAAAKSALFTLQASDQLVARLETIEQINRSAFELAERQQAAGNISELDLANHQALYEQARIDVVQARAQSRVDREALNRELGAWGDEADFQIVAGLPALPNTDPTLSGLESLAMERRLDLAAGRLAIDIVGQALAIKKGTRFLPAGIEVGVSRERDTDRRVVLGPTLRIQIPVFDTGAASVAALEAQYRQSQRQLEALAVRARSEVRTAQDLLISARDRTEHYQHVVLPLRVRILEQTLLHYNMMLKGAYDVLLARQQEAEVEKTYITAWRDYWIARVELERSVGGRLPAPDATSAATATNEHPDGSPGGHR
ncbi:MAG: TolC family protein [Acidobacteriota bacterium]